MNEKQNEQKIFDTLHDDIRHGDLWHSFRKDASDLKEFYLDSEKKSRLSQMSWFKRIFYFPWWVLKSMFFRLTPARRILMILGLFFLFSFELKVEQSNVRFTNVGTIGGAIILFVLLLELKDKLLARDELEAGRKIQNALMPERSPQVPGWSLWLFTRSANDVGGDLIDFLRINAARNGIAIADVAGKGLRAALFTTKLQATIRALVSDYDSLSAFCAKVNMIFQRDGVASIFASLLYAEIGEDAGRIRFVNAGHLPPLRVDQEGGHDIFKGERALGLSKASDYTEQMVDLKSGEIFLAYSDGVTEALNKAGEFYGHERFSKLLSQIYYLPADKMGESIVADVDRFVGDAPASDDISLFVLKRT